jgi:hypothetical protein
VVPQHLQKQDHRNSHQQTVKMVNIQLHHRLQLHNPTMDRTDHLPLHLPTTMATVVMVLGQATPNTNNKLNLFLNYDLKVV